MLPVCIGRGLSCGMTNASATSPASLRQEPTWPAHFYPAVHPDLPSEPPGLTSVDDATVSSQTFTWPGSGDEPVTCDLRPATLGCQPSRFHTETTAEAFLRDRPRGALLAGCVHGGAQICHVYCPFCGKNVTGGRHWRIQGVALWVADVVSWTLHRCACFAFRAPTPCGCVVSAARC